MTCRVWAGLISLCNAYRHWHDVQQAKEMWQPEQCCRGIKALPEYKWESRHERTIICPCQVCIVSASFLPKNKLPSFLWLLMRRKETRRCWGVLVWVSNQGVAICIGDPWLSPTRHGGNNLVPCELRTRWTDFIHFGLILKGFGLLINWKINCPQSR